MIKVLPNLFFGLFAVALLLTPLHGARAEADPVVAEFGKEKIRLSEVKALHRAQAPDMPFEAFFNQTTDGMVNDRLVADEALRAGLKDDPVVKNIMRLKEAETIMRVYMERRLGKMVTEDVLKAEYKIALKDMPPRQEAHIRRIVVATEAEARTILADYKKTGDFAALAKAKSITQEAAQGGDMGYVASDQLQPPLARAVFSLAKGAVSKEPMELGGVWSLYKVEDLRTAPKPTFEQVKGALVRMVSQKAMRKVVTDLRAAAKVKRYNIDGSPMK